MTQFASLWFPFDPFKDITALKLSCKSQKVRILAKEKTDEFLLLYIYDKQSSTPMQPGVKEIFPLGLNSYEQMKIVWSSARIQKFCCVLSPSLKEWQKSRNIMKRLKMSQRWESSVGRLRIEGGWNIKQSCVINHHFSAPTVAFPAFSFLLCPGVK